MNFHRLDDAPDAPEGRAIAMGTFDGVHAGHRRVIGSALDWARRHAARASVVTFDPHPLRVLSPDEPPKLLTTTAVKADDCSTSDPRQGSPTPPKRSAAFLT